MTGFDDRENACWPVGRRAALKATLAGGMAAAMPWGRPAAAAPADPDHGPLVTPDPIAAAITASGLEVALVDFATPPATSTTRAFARLNHLFHAGDGSGFLYVNDTRGKFWRIDGRTGAVSLFLDFALARNGALVTGGLEQGFRSFAFHPDFARSGAAGFNRLYTLSTETTASRPSGVTLFDDDHDTHSTHNVLAEWTVFAGDRSRVNPNSRRELLRIAQWRGNHNADQPIFNPRAKRGTAAYGKLLFLTGDGGGAGDPAGQAQNPLRLQGKVCRIDPLGSNRGRYGVPADNPFIGNAAYLPEIWALGLRHPQNICFDFDRRRFIFSDIGQANIEEVNILVKGANYGWANREGTFVTDRASTGTLYGLGSSDAQRGYTYPVAQYDHGEGRAITGGFVYTGAAIPALRGHYLCGDIVNGRVFHVPAADLQLGSRAGLRELTLRRNGQVVRLLDLVGADRVDLRFGQDANGEMFIVTKQDGVIRKIVPV